MRKCCANYSSEGGGVDMRAAVRMEAAHSAARLGSAARISLEQPSERCMAAQRVLIEPEPPHVHGVM